MNQFKSQFISRGIRNFKILLFVATKVNLHALSPRDHHSPDGTPITTRQLESMIRLSEARARSELRNTVTAQDALDVIFIMKSCLWSAYQDDTGALDFSRSQNGKF